MVKNFIVILLFFSPLSWGDNIDYSKQNYSKFSYEKEQGYFNKEITNPLDVAKSNKSCWDIAADVYGLDPWLLFSVAIVESRLNPHAINKNKNNSIDVGLMQINSYWFKTLNSFGIKPSHLLDPCTSIMVGAWIMAQNIKHYGYNIDGVGAYNSPNKELRRKYGMKVYSTYNYITKKWIKNG